MWLFFLKHILLRWDLMFLLLHLRQAWFYLLTEIYWALLSFIDKNQFCWTYPTNRVFHETLFPWAILPTVYAPCLCFLILLMGLLEQSQQQKSFIHCWQSMPSSMSFKYTNRFMVPSFTRFMPREAILSNFLSTSRIIFKILHSLTKSVD